MIKGTKSIAICALKEKGVNKPCNRCDSTEFELLGMTHLGLNSQLTEHVIPIECYIIACSHCGFITLHSVVALLKQNCCMASEL